MRVRREWVVDPEAGPGRRGHGRRETVDGVGGQVIVLGASVIERISGLAISGRLCRMNDMEVEEGMGLDKVR